MPYRFYSPDLMENGPVNLPETEFHHLVHVLRLKNNDQIDVFNGNGLVVSCQITAIRKRDVELRPMGSRLDRPIQPVVILATAVPKGDRFDWLIEKATELGVSHLIPLTTARSVVDPRTSKLDKLRQTVIAACKQSGRNHLMQISQVTSWAQFAKTMIPQHRVLIAHPQGDAVSQIVGADDEGKRPLLLAIGPEGGFSAEEIELGTQSGAELVHLGPRILRIETAAIALSARFLLEN